MIRVDIRYDTKEMESVKLDVAFDLLPRLNETVHIDGQTYVIRQIIHFPADMDRNVELYVDDEPL